jgi:hypothetical protein
MNNTLLILSSQDATGVNTGNDPNNPSYFVLPTAINVGENYDCFIELQKFNSFNLLSNITPNLNNNIIKIANVFYNYLTNKVRTFTVTFTIPDNYYTIDDILNLLNTKLQATMQVTPQYSFTTPGKNTTNTIYLGFPGNVFSLNEDNCIVFNLPSNLGYTTNNQTGYTYQKNFLDSNAVDEFAYIGVYFISDDSTNNLLDLLGLTLNVAPTISGNTNLFGYGFITTFGKTSNLNQLITYVEDSITTLSLQNVDYSINDISYPVSFPTGYSRNSTLYNATYNYNLQPYTAILCCVDIPLNTLTSNAKTTGFNVLGIIDLDSNYGESIAYSEYVPTLLKIPTLTSLHNIQITFRTLDGEIISFEGIPWTLSLRIFTKLSTQATINQSSAIQQNNQIVPIFGSNLVNKRVQQQQHKRSKNDVHAAFNALGNNNYKFN